MCKWYATVWVRWKWTAMQNCKTVNQFKRIQSIFANPSPLESYIISAFLLADGISDGSHPWINLVWMMLLYPLDCSACPSPLIHSWNPFGCEIAVFMASWRKLHVLSYVLWAHLPKDVCLAGSSGCEVLKELIDSVCGVQCFAVGTLCAWSVCVFPWHNQRIGVIQSQEICISPASCFEYIHNMRQHHILSRCYLERLKECC